ncbi:MAG: glycoside hydrolase family 92 protein, partial [Sphingomonadales bacterium]|nr:glycoside hydrolase family 92 protein [Sphingomonadales bacterium]
GGFDAALALEAIRKDGEVESPDPLNVGRVLESYRTLGYMPLDRNRSASRTLEYAYDDFAIAEVAQALGRHDEAARFLTRSGNWRNLWDKGLNCIRPRYRNGDWLANFDCGHLYPDNRTAWWDAPFYEGSSLQYSTFVPHDVAGLIALTGGDQAFTAWLDQLFDSGGYDHSNEPDFLAPYLYIHAGRPDRTADRVRAILARDYRPTHDGLPGNDDAGAMSSWYVWSAIGLFPNAGQPFYYIGSPLFTRSTIRLEQGRSLTIAAPAASPDRRYVVAARLNGRPIDRAWLTHDEIAHGGLLELDMAAAPAGWATRFQPPLNPFLPARTAR